MSSPNNTKKRPFTSVQMSVKSVGSAPNVRIISEERPTNAAGNQLQQQIQLQVLHQLFNKRRFTAVHNQAGIIQEPMRSKHQCQPRVQSQHMIHNEAPLQLGAEKNAEQLPKAHLMTKSMSLNSIKHINSTSTPDGSQMKSMVTQPPQRSPSAFIVETIQCQASSSPRTGESPKEYDTFFTKPTQAQIEGYTNNVVNAVRNRDIPTLRYIHNQSKDSSSSCSSLQHPLSCCNRFGESLLHMACRRGYIDVVSFLLSEGGLSLWVRDDYGRTPMHDACWTPKPNFDLMELLLRWGDPRVLLVKDVRGHMPFDYVRKEHWSEWVEFLMERKKWLVIERGEDEKRDDDRTFHIDVVNGAPNHPGLQSQRKVGDSEGTSIDRKGSDSLSLKPAQTNLQLCKVAKKIVG